MQANKVQFARGYNLCQCTPCRSIFIVETKAIPNWVNARVHVYTDSYPWFFVHLFGNIYQLVHLVKMVNVNERIVVDSQFQFFIGLLRAIENNFVARHTIAQCLSVFKSAHHFAPATFLVKNVADCIDIIRLVAPGKLHFWIAGFKSPYRIFVSAANGAFADYKHWGTMGFYQSFYRNTVNLFHWFVLCSGTIFVHQTRIHFNDGGAFVF